MIAYAIRRILLMIPTLLAIMVVNFFIIQAAPGGPIQQMISKLKGSDVSATERISGAGGELKNQGGGDSQYRGARGLDPAFIKELEKQYGFDKPPVERFLLMMKNYLSFNFGKSYFRDTPVLSLIAEKLPVSVSLGLWMTLISYFISIPLGIRKALLDGSSFDVWTSTVIIIGYAIPGFLFAISLIVLFAGGSFFDVFPLRGLTSDNWEELSWPARIGDYFWHLALPLTCFVIGSFAVVTMLTKNTFVEEMRKQYVLVARARGLASSRVLYKHIFRNALIPLVTGFPAAFIGAFFAGSVLIETLFSLDGLGLLSYEAAIRRDFPVVLGSLYLFTLIALVVKLISDVMYVVIDPRVHFGSVGK